MTTFTFQLNFFDLGDIQTESTRVRAILSRIDTELNPELENILLEVAGMVKSLAKTYVRVDTGSLQKSIRVERKGKHSIGIRAGGYIINPKTGRLVDYAGYVEWKYPYMEPAYKQVLPLLDQRIDSLIMRLVSG